MNEWNKRPQQKPLPNTGFAESYPTRSLIRGDTIPEIHEDSENERRQR